MFSHNSSESKGKNNIGKKHEKNTSRKSENNVGGEGKNNGGGENKDNNGRKSENNAYKNGKTLNVKLKIGEVVKKLNLDEIVAGKLTFGCIAKSLVDIPIYNTITLDHIVVPLIIPLVLLVSGFFAFSNTTSDFPNSGYPALGPLFFLIPSSPTFFRLSSFVVPLVALDAFLHDPYLAFLVDGGTIKLLAEVIIKPFGDNLFIIAHLVYDGLLPSMFPIYFLKSGLSICSQVLIPFLTHGVNAALVLVALSLLLTNVDRYMIVLIKDF